MPRFDPHAVRHHAEPSPDLRRRVRGRYRGEPVRLLVVPGLHDSGPAHWQTWLQAHFRQAVRVEQDRWDQPDLAAWSSRIADTLARHGPGPWVAVAHSFGCLALAHHLGRQAPGQGVQAAVLVAPADPGKFGVSSALPQDALPLPVTMVASETDPWMQLDAARCWARRWRTQFINLGDVGHINVDSGHGPLPQVKTLVELKMMHVERQRRIERAHPLELTFAV